MNVKDCKAGTRVESLTTREAFTIVRRDRQARYRAIVVPVSGGKEQSIPMNDLIVLVPRPSDPAAVKRIRDAWSEVDSHRV